MKNSSSDITSPPPIRLQEHRARPDHREKNKDHEGFRGVFVTGGKGDSELVSLPESDAVKYEQSTQGAIIRNTFDGKTSYSRMERVEGQSFKCRQLVLAVLHEDSDHIVFYGLDGKPAASGKVYDGVDEKGKMVERVTIESGEDVLLSDKLGETYRAMIEQLVLESRSK